MKNDSSEICWSIIWKHQNHATNLTIYKPTDLKTYKPPSIKIEKPKEGGGGGGVAAAVPLWRLYGIDEGLYVFRSVGL